MQNVLSLDVSIEPAQAVVVKFAGRNAEVVESHLIDLNGIFSRERLLANLDSNGATEEPSSISATSNLNATQQKDIFNPLAVIQTPYTSSALILPPYNYFSLNIELPFSDPRNIEKILSFELQDRVPFEVDSFLLDYKSISALNGKGFDVHVGLLPKQLMTGALKNCSRMGLEPVIMTAPQSALEACFYYAPDYFKENSAAMMVRGNDIYLLMRFNNLISIDRVLSLESHYNTNSSAKDLYGMLPQVKLNLFAAENRYGNSVERVYLLGDTLAAKEVEKAIGRKVEPINIEDLVKASRREFSLATLAATLAYDDYASPVFTNFRVAEFSYRPKVKELLRILKQAASYLLATLLAFILMVAILLMIQRWEISSLRNTMRSHIKEVIPTLNLQQGSELNQVTDAIKDLSQELKSLGSPIEFSLMEVLYEVVGSFPASADTTLTDVTIDTTNPKQNKVTIKGKAPDNKALDKIEGIYKKKTNMFKRVDGFDSKTTSSGYSYGGSRDGAVPGKDFEGQLFLDDK